MELEQEALRGTQARELLDNPLLIEAFETVEKAYIDAWKNEQSLKPENREYLWKLVRTVQDVRKHLETAVETGKMAKIQLQQKSLRERMSQALSFGQT